MFKPLSFSWIRAKRHPVQALLTLLTVSICALAVNTALSVSRQFSPVVSDPDRFKVIAGYSEGTNNTVYPLFKPGDLEGLGKLTPTVKTLELQGWGGGDLLEYGGKRYKLGQSIGVGPRYAELTDLELVRGSFLSGKPGEAVVSEAFARALFGTASGLGQSFSSVNSYGESGQPPEVFRVVGVMQQPKGEVNAPHLILPIKVQKYPSAAILLVQAKPGQGAAARAEVLAAVRQTYKGKVSGLQKDAQGAPRVRVVSMGASEFSLFAANSANPLPRLFSVFAIAMLVIGAVGLFALQLSENAERAREVGLRRAMGAPASAVVLERLLEAGGLVLLGAVLGTVLSALLLPLMESLTGTALFRSGLSFTSLTALSTVLLLLGVAALSSLYPAWAAARTRPSELLREV